ncbi:MAG: LPXTG-motif cell wall anchor domain protein [Parcubacteria group bacterium GW2011_GWC2_42_12]|uniref:LPXTG-motif cell wall anchor domain protein n=1 Tax=Candidatus Falkowbacteria bacterium GW2011_GWA2_41_14 TaxID=1618635 RepID=A0A0G0UR09_9BACT|nr:MAG: LPXTG-motif cell wall anchor domain protein [Candidatus Falkowbacteria bacterium GW2011_GWA2_41_14]KKS33350.1 MAG: LPXTG-motif cell wall anchor domain protein [Parcubacteria group bacterium GW2011_GWC2_42_12]
MERFKKIFAAGVIFVTVLSMSVVVAPQAGAVASAGDLIKMAGLSSVYYLAADGKRYVFPNESTYFSWYGDFSGVVTIPQAELESYPLGKNVTVRPGTKLVKITTNPKVYAVTTGGTLVAVPDEATAATLYGANWNKRIIDVPDAFFTNYITSSATVSASAYPQGSLVKFGASADTYFINADGTASKIATEAAFTANRFKWADVITATIAKPTTGSDIAGAVATLTDTASGAGGTIGAGTGLTVALASDTAAASTIPAGSPTTFLKINLTAANDGAVSVNAIKLKTFELGTATYVDSVTFYDNGVKVGTAKNINSDKEATFNFSTPIVVAAGTTKSLVVKATIVAGQTSGNFALGIAAASDITTNGAAVSGSFPVRGNVQAVTSSTIGTVTMANVGTSDTSNDFGEDNVLLAKFDLTAANEAVIFSGFAMKNGGTNTAGIVGNMRVVIDGDEVVKGGELVDKIVTFSFNKVIIKNDTITVEVYGDIGIGNTTNTIDLYFYEAGDLYFTGQDYGYGIEVGSTGFGGLDAVSDGIVVTLTAGDVTIDMDKTATPSKDVRPGDNSVVLATVKVLSAGENATITALGAGADSFYITGTNPSCTKLDNAVLKDTVTGASYDLTIASSTTASYCKLTNSDEISLVKGVTKTYQVKVDVAGSNDTNPAVDSDTLQVVLKSTGFTISGDDSDASLQSSITPTSVSGSIATVKTASLTWQTTALTAKTIVPSAKDVVVYAASLEAGASSAVTLTQVKIHSTSTVASAFSDTNISQLRLYVDNKLVKTVAGGIVEPASGTAGYINFTSLDTTNRVIPAGKTVTLEVKADFASTFSPSGVIGLTADGVAASIVAQDKDSNAVAESVKNAATLSRTVTLASAGTLKVELTTTDLKSNNNTIVLAGSKITSGDKYLGKLTFTTANEPIKVKTLVLGQQGTARADDIASVELYDKNEVLVASKGVSTLGDANFSDLNLVLSADNVHEYFIGITARGINVLDDPSATADDAETIIYTLASSTQLTQLGLLADDAVTAVGVDLGDDITCVEDTNGTVAAGDYAEWGIATSTTATIHGSILTSITNPMSDTTLTNGTDQIIGKYKFIFNNGSNRNSDNTELKARLVTLGLSLATSTGVLITNVQAYFEGDISNKTAVASMADNSAVATSTFSALSGTTEDVDGEVTIVIEGDISGAETSDFVQTKIADLTYRFVYNGNNGTGTDVSNVLLNISEVQGAKRSN